MSRLIRSGKRPWGGPKTYLGILVRYRWGWDLRLPGGYLSYSRGDPGEIALWWSPDATFYHERARVILRHRRGGRGWTLL